MTLYEQSLDISRDINDRARILSNLNNLADVHLHLENLDAGRVALQQSLEIAQETSDITNMLFGIAVAARWYHLTDASERSATLAHFADAHPSTMADVKMNQLQPLLDKLKGTLSADAYEKARQASTQIDLKSLIPDVLKSFAALPVSEGEKKDDS